jgi:hypothetical protein
MLALAGRVADRVAPALRPTATTSDLEAAVAAVRAAAAGRATPPGITQALVGVGDRVPARLAAQGLDAAALAAGDAAGLLTGDAEAVAAVLRDRYERYGVDEVVVADELAGALEPVIGVLRGARLP